jgi:hypothetical protein
MKDIEFKWSNLPLLSVTLIDRATMKHVDSYILRLFLLYEQEEEVPCGLSWAKRNPLSFYTDPQNPQQVAGVTLRVRVPEKMFDFRKASGANGSKPQGKVIVSSSSHHYTATTEWFNLLPKRRAHQDAGHNDDVTMYLSWTQHSDPISNFMPQETSPNSNENDEAFFVDESEHSLDFPLLAADYEESYVRIADGNAEVSGNFRALNFYRASDRRLKTDITLLSSDRDCRQKLLCIEGVEYKFKAGSLPSDQKFIGYIAQQVQQHIPEAVTIIDGVMHVDYQSLLPFMSESLRQTYTDVENVGSQLTQLINAVEQMRSQFSEQQTESRINATISSSVRRKRIWLAVFGSCLLVALTASLVLLIQSNIDNNRPPGVENPVPLKDSLQREILLEFFNTTNGELWTTKNGWLSQSNECEWFGISCNSEGNIIEIDIPFNQLNGNIPNSIQYLTSLQVLHLSHNILRGSIPYSITALRNLKQLRLNNNNLEGSIPFMMGGMENLEIVELSFNHLTGSVPSWKGAARLKELLLDNNQLHYANQFTCWRPPQEVSCSMEGNPFECPLPAWFSFCNADCLESPL